MENIVSNFINQIGFVSKPTTDGRIEVPRSLIKRLHFDKELYINVHRYKIVISENHGADSYKIINAEGRIRIPSFILKKSNLINKSVRMSICNNEIFIMANPDIDGFIKTLNKRQLRFLYNIIVGESDLKPVIVLPDRLNAIKFKIIGKPYTFPGVFVNGEILLPSDNKNDNLMKQLYFIPGLFRDVPGFLFVKHETFLKISKKIITMGDLYPEIIIFFDPFVGGLFNVVINPYIEVSDDLIQDVEKTCNCPEEFVFQTFQMEKSDFTKRETFPLLCVQNFPLLSV